MRFAYKKHFRNAILLPGLFAFMAGCSWFSSEEDEGAAKSLPPLEVPPDLIRPYSPDKVVEPALPEKTSQGQDCQCGEQPPKIGEAVLPPGKGVKKLKDGQHSWLVISLEPEQVWPLAKEFLERRGYQIGKDEPAVGLLETNWKNRFENTDGEGVSDVRERLRLRLEPGQEAGTTEVYLSQYGSERVTASGDSDAGQWRLRETDTERSAEMLNRFARFLGGDKVENAAALSSMTSHMDTDKDGGSVLVVEAGFEKVWRRTAIALDKLGFVIEDKDRAAGVYRAYNELPTGKTEEELKHGKPESATVREDYRVHLVEDGANTNISVRNEAGQTDNSEVALHLLNLLHGQFQ